MKEPKTVYALGCRRRAMSVSDYTQAFAQFDMEDGQHCVVLSPVAQGHENTNVSIALSMKAPLAFIQAVLKLVSKKLWEYGYYSNANNAYELIEHFTPKNRKWFPIGYGLSVRLCRIPKGNSIFDVLAARQPGLYVEAIQEAEPYGIVNLAKLYRLYEPQCTYELLPMKLVFDKCTFGTVKIETVSAVVPAPDRRPCRHIMAFPEVTYADPLLRTDIGKLYWIAERKLLVLAKCDKTFSHFVRTNMDVLHAEAKRNFDPKLPAFGLMPISKDEIAPLFYIRDQPTRALPRHVTRVDAQNSFRDPDGVYDYVIVGEALAYSEQIRTDFAPVVEKIAQDIEQSLIDDSLATRRPALGSAYLIEPKLITTRMNMDRNPNLTSIERYELIKNDPEFEMTEEGISSDSSTETGLNEAYGDLFDSKEQALLVQQFWRVNSCDVLTPETIAKLLSGSPPIFSEFETLQGLGLLVDYASPVRSSLH